MATYEARGWHAVRHLSAGRSKNSDATMEIQMKKAEIANSYNGRNNQMDRGVKNRRAYPTYEMYLEKRRTDA